MANSVKGFRVLKIAPTSFFADYGCHVRILEETIALEALGVQVTICTYHSGRDLPGLDIRRALQVPWKNGPQPGSSLHKLYFDVLLSLRSLQSSATSRPHVIHAHLHEGALIGKVLSTLYRVPLVFDFQGSLTSEMIDHDFIRRESPFFGPLRWLETQINEMADAIVTSSHHAADVLSQQFGCPREKIHPLPDGVNIDRFRPKWEYHQDQIAALKRRLGIPPDRAVVVYLGLLAEYQGSSHLLQAATHLLRQMPFSHFLIMGFPGQLRYQVMAESLGIADHVTFTGRIPYEEAPIHLALGDIAISPKLSETEGNGKLLNYMAVGLPTITFNTPVSREILGDLGVYAETGNAVALAEAINATLTRPDRDILSRKLRSRAEEQFNWAEAGRTLVQLYQRLCR